MMSILGTPTESISDETYINVGGLNIESNINKFQVADLGIYDPKVPLTISW